MRILLLIFILLILQGCVKVVKDPLVPPEEAIAEITMFGVTLSTEDRPFPETVNEELHQGDPAYVHVPNLIWYFSPHPDYSELEDGKISGFLATNFVFGYRFTNDNAGSSIEIPSTNGFDVSYPPTSYPGVADIRETPEEFLISSNYLIQAAIVRIPLTATHIEVLMTVPNAIEPVSISKVALESLKAWRDYVEPYR